jgi:pyruvate/2-oxoglutarate dehydrogenase complex dihydrolipoamide acyltransferase (E2) component
MPKVPIIMPQLGESIAEATVVRLTVNVGDQIETDQEVIEVETNKAVMSVTTPCKGLIESITAEVNETYPVGSTLGYIEASLEDAERLNTPEPPWTTKLQQTRQPLQSILSTFLCRVWKFPSV